MELSGIGNMDIHDTLSADHDALRGFVEKIRAQRASATVDSLTPLLRPLQESVRAHFAREEAYYRTVDADKRFQDRGFIHQLRNDHAALLFGMESLLIRLRKNGPADAWWRHFDNLMNVFLPHMDNEEHKLFPEAERLLTPEEWATIRAAMAEKS